MSPLYESLTSVSEKLFDAVVNLNLKGPFRLSALIGERMVADGGGSIINVSSSGSLRPAPDMLPYAAAKAGLNALTEGLAKAVGPTVRVNTLMAGPFLTDISKSWNLERAVKPFGHLSLQRAGQPAEIIGAALFLMSDASSFTTGSILRADGGLPDFFVEIAFRVVKPRQVQPRPQSQRYGVTMLFGSGRSSTAKSDGSALASPLTSNPASRCRRPQKTTAAACSRVSPSRWPSPRRREPCGRPAHRCAASAGSWSRRRGR